MMEHLLDDDREEIAQRLEDYEAWYQYQADSWKDDWQFTKEN